VLLNVGAQPPPPVLRESSSSWRRGRIPLAAQVRFISPAVRSSVSRSHDVTGRRVCMVSGVDLSAARTRHVERRDGPALWHGAAVYMLKARAGGTWGQEAGLQRDSQERRPSGATELSRRIRSVPKGTARFASGEPTKSTISVSLRPGYFNGARRPRAVQLRPTCEPREIDPGGSSPAA